MYDPFHSLLVAQRVAVEHERRLLARLSEEERLWLVRILDALAPSPEPADG